jgi:uncharacterized protein YjiS (DUF1127 family)
MSSTLARPGFEMPRLFRLYETGRGAWRRHRHRRELSRLVERGPRLLNDIGLTVADAEVEANAPFWRSPHLPRLPLI